MAGTSPHASEGQPSSPSIDRHPAKHGTDTATAAAAPSATVSAATPTATTAPAALRSPPRRVHVVVLVHGNHGSPGDWARFHAPLRKHLGEDVVVIASESNADTTHRGVAIGGRRLADEVIAGVRRVRERLAAAAGTSAPVLALSIICHSLGGLYGRYALRQLAASDATRPTQLGGSMEWTSFVTLCSPHLGSRRPGGNLLKGLWRGAVHGVVGNLYGHTGQDLLLQEPTHEPVPEDVATGSSTGGSGAAGAGAGSAAAAAPSPPPSTPVSEVVARGATLLRMSQPGSEWMRALGHFAHRTLVAMVEHDLSVPYAAAAVQRASPHAPVGYGESKWHVARHAGFSSDVVAHALRRHVASTRADAGGAATAGAATTAGAAVASAAESEPAPTTVLATSPIVSTEDVTVATTATDTAPETPPSASGDGGATGAAFAADAGELVADGRGEVEFPSRLHDWLHSVRWRQIDLCVALRTPGLKPAVHNFPIGKNQWASKPMTTGSGECIDMLARVLAVDHNVVAT